MPVVSWLVGVAGSRGMRRWRRARRPARRRAGCRRASRSTRRSASSSPGTRMRSVPGASSDACTSSISAVDVRAERVDGEEARHVEHHEAGALGQAVPAGELRLAVLGGAEAAVGEHAGHDLDQQPDAEALVAAEPLQLRDRRRLRIGGGVAVLVVGPALGDRRVAALAGEEDLVAGRGGGGDVVDDVGVATGGHRVRERVGREQAGGAAERAARSWRRSGTPSRSTRRPTRASCSSRARRGA